MTEHCPDLEVLVAYLLGKLGQSDTRLTAAHIDVCPACETSIEALEATSGSLVEHFGEFPPEHDFSRDPQYRELLARAQALRPRPPATPIVIDMLQDATRMFVGEYRLLSKLGSGKMDVVWKAEHVPTRRRVAIRTLAPSRLKSPEAVRRFYQKVEALATLLHPNLVAVFGAVEHHGTHYLVMEYIDGQDLAWLVKHHGRLPPRLAAGYIRQAALGLHYAHSNGVTHCRVKLDSLLVDGGGTVKILDLGLVEPSALGHSPEGDRLADAGRSADARNDIYSLGCTLFHLLAGRPYVDQTLADELMGHRESSLSALTALCREVPPRLAAICVKMFATQPGDRYQTMAQVAAVLEGFANSER